MPSHNHKVQKNRGGGKDIIAALQPGTWNVNWGLPGTNNALENTGGNQPHNNIHPVLGVNYIMKISKLSL